MAFINVSLVRAQKQYKSRQKTRDCDYRILYRFDKENVKWISDHFLGEKNEHRGGALTNYQKMKIFLRYMADPGFQTGVGEDVGVDQTTVSKTVHQVRQKIMDKAHIWIKFPTTPAEIMQAKEKWQTKFKMPTAIGAIDCTHIRIAQPKVNGDEYLNRKKFSSLNVQATCDSTECFTSVSAEWPGSVHDSRVFKNSSIFEVMKKTTNTILIGDSGYAISPWLITPYDNATTPMEKNFNKIYATERVIIERCFGQLKRRFPILNYKVRTALPTIPAIITCCVVLHNIAKHLNDPDDFPSLLENQPTNQIPENINNNEIPRRQVRQLGQEKRNRFAIILFNQ